MKLKKKFLFVIITLMVLGIASIGIYYFETRGNKNLNDATNLTDVKEDAKDSLKDDKQSEEKDTNDLSDSKEENEEGTKEKDLTNDSKKETSSNSSVKPNDEKTNNSNENNSGNNKKEDNSNSNIPDTNNSNDKSEENNVPEDNNEPNTDIKDTTPEVDQELENMKKIYRYANSEICYQKSIDVAFKYADNENFKHTACRSGAYKGQLVGYALLIYYKDNTTEYYMGD